MKVPSKKIAHPGYNITSHLETISTEGLVLNSVIFSFQKDSLTQQVNDRSTNAFQMNRNVDMSL